MQAVADETSPSPTVIRAVSSVRLEFLDALRGVAALLVVIQHVGERYTVSIPWFTQTWFNFGRLGVTVFFLVSGFVIPYACEKDGSVRSFWIKRIFRLYPLYWLSLALTVIARIEPSDFPAQHFVRNVLVNATMLQGFVGIPNASSPYWTLFIEMAFYLAFTVWFLFGLHKKSMFWAWTGVLAFFAISVAAPLIKGTHAPITKVFCFLAVLVGSVFYRHFSGQASRPAIVVLLLAVVVLAGAGAYLNFFRLQSSEQISAISVFLSWAGAFLLFLLVFSLRGRHFPFVLLWLGKLSYSLYLLHAIVLDTMPNFGNPTLTFLAVLSASLCLSTISFRYLERPFVSIGHRLARR